MYEREQRLELLAVGQLLGGEGALGGQIQLGTQQQLETQPASLDSMLKRFLQDVGVVVTEPSVLRNAAQNATGTARDAAGDARFKVEAVSSRRRRGGGEGAVGALMQLGTQQERLETQPGTLDSVLKRFLQEDVGVVVKEPSVHRCSSERSQQRNRSSSKRSQERSIQC